MVLPAPWSAAAAAMGKFSTFHTFVTANIPVFTACCRLIGTSLKAHGLFMQLKTRSPCQGGGVTPVSISAGRQCFWFLNRSKQSILDTKNTETKLISLKV